MSVQTKKTKKKELQAKNKYPFFFKHFNFSSRSLYFKSDNLILRLAKAAGEVLGKTHDELMYAFGVYMVKKIANYGYEQILKVTR